MAIALLVAACSRGSGSDGSGAVPGPSVTPPASASASASISVTASATATASPAVSDTPPAPTSSTGPPSNPPPEGEAKRSTLAALDRDPLLRSQLAKLRDHFGKDARGPFAMQQVGLAEGRVAVLVSRPDESDPIVLAVDPVGPQLLFAKERPTAGIAPPVQHATVSPGPERGVAVFSYVASMHIVAARMWADDANPYADIEVFHPEACDELSVAYRARVGWIVACASKSGTRAQRLRDDLTAAWGADGVPVGTASPVGRARITFDAPLRWTLSQRAKAVGGDRDLTYRYDLDGQPLP